MLTSLSPNAACIAATCSDGTVGLWSLSTLQTSAPVAAAPEETHVGEVDLGEEDAPEMEDEASSATTSTVTSASIEGVQSSAHDIHAPIARFEHFSRANRCKFHPSGKFLATTSHDTSMRWWDVERQQCVLIQPFVTLLSLDSFLIDSVVSLSFSGHAHPTFGLAVNHPDGSLCATGDMAGHMHLWDTRTGRTVHSWQHAHADGILSCDFSGSGVHLATGGLDNFTRIWDLRAKRACYSIPSHSKLISSVQFSRLPMSITEQRSSTVPMSILSSSFDGTVRLFSGLDMKMQKTMPGETRISCASYNSGLSRFFFSLKYQSDIVHQTVFFFCFYSSQTHRCCSHR